MRLKIVALAISVEFPCCESRANGGRYLPILEKSRVQKSHATFFAYSALNINF